MLGRWRHALAQALRRHAALLAVAALGLTGLTAAAIGLRDPLALADLLQPTLLRLWLVLSVLGLLVSLPFRRLALRDARGGRLPALEAWGRTGRDVHRNLLSPVRLASAAVGALSLALVFNVFAAWKRIIPQVAPFRLDPALASADRWLHGGRAPHEWLAPLLSRADVTLALDRVYTHWPIVIGMALVPWLWRPDSPDRRRVLLGVAFTTLGLGAVLATLASSAGPCFYAAATGLDDPYAAHLAWLRTVAATTPLEVPGTQALMWQLHAAGRSPLYFGISAMPSLHVALPALLAIASWRAHRPWALALGAFTLLTFVATIHLGWHYALDGYVAVALVAAWWRVSGPRAARA